MNGADKTHQYVHDKSCVQDAPERVRNHTWLPKKQTHGRTCTRCAAGGEVDGGASPGSRTHIHTSRSTVASVGQGNDVGRTVLASTRPGWLQTFRGVQAMTGEAALDAALEQLASCTTLELDIFVGDRGAQRLAEALHENTTVVVLTLQGNGIENRGAKHLAEGLYHNTTLTVFSLEDNRIGDGGVQHLAEALHQNHL